MNRLLTALALALCLGIAACGDDEDTADTTPPPTTEATVAPPPETETETTEAEEPAEGAELSRADAESEAARQASLAADEVPGSDLFFASGEDVECEAPDATQPDNANERSAEWTCSVDADTNNVTCKGTVVVFGSPGANPGKTFEDIDVRDADFSCSPS